MKISDTDLRRVIREEILLAESARAGSLSYRQDLALISNFVSSGDFKGLKSIPMTNLEQDVFDFLVEQTMVGNELTNKMGTHANPKVKSIEMGKIIYPWMISASFTINEDAAKKVLTALYFRGVSYDGKNLERDSDISNDVFYYFKGKSRK
jgi:hypothetical protein